MSPISHSVAYGETKCPPTDAAREQPSHSVTEPALARQPARDQGFYQDIAR
jgi:hypothetical protein